MLKVAELELATRTGTTHHVVGGEPQTDFAALVIAQYPDEDSCYLFYCDESWNAVTDTFHVDLDSAVNKQCSSTKAWPFAMSDGSGSSRKCRTWTTSSTAKSLTEQFNGWPSFHDAEVYGLRLDSGPAGRWRGAT